ncbi:ATP synthase protein I [Methylophilaceae bacterium]|nr:ATP synthase protein I [Methylophilaceae bacterium]
MSEEKLPASAPENEKISVIFRRAAKWQSISTSAIALVAYWFAGFPGLISALIGGGVVLAGSFIASRIAKRSEHSTQAGAILINMLIAEAIKILVIVLLLWLSFKIYAGSIVLVALFCALAAAAILSGTAVYALNSESDKQG